MEGIQAWFMELEHMSSFLDQEPCNTKELPLRNLDSSH